MFRQLVTPFGGGLSKAVMNNIESLFAYHPLQISAIVETVWLNRMNAGTSETSSPFMPWSPQVSFPLLQAPFFSGYDWTTPNPTPLPPPVGFTPPLLQPGLIHTWDGVSAPIQTRFTNWDHLIYAYVIENTRILEIFGKVLDTYIAGEQLETPSQAGQQFWRNLECLIYGDALPTMLWTTPSRVRRDEVANRLSSYYWMFGMDLAHASDLATRHPYQKPAAANRDFASTFEAFAREAWRGIVNAKNTSGSNDTDPTVIATLARRLYDMMATRRLNGNISREEFRAVAIVSFVHLAVLYDSPIVVDLKATASSPEMRLQKIAERVDMKAHVKSKPFFDLAGPFSILMQSIEAGAFNDTTGAATLYAQPPTIVSANAEQVIDQYSLATGRDLKSQTVSVVSTGMRAPVRPAMPASSQRTDRMDRQPVTTR